MYLHKITLSNIRGFESLEFDLQRPDNSYAGWTVFTGDNGSGKSTLLKAVGTCLVGKDTARSLQPSFHRWIRQQKDGGEQASIMLEIIADKSDDNYSAPGKTTKQPHFAAKIVLSNGGKEASLEPVPPDGKTESYKTPQRSIWSPDKTGWFSCGYGPFRRVFGASSEATAIMVTPTTARYATMFQEAASLAEADRWLRDLKYKELEGKQAEKATLEVLLEILRDELMPNGMSLVRVDSDGLWVADRQGVELAWGEMSDGYRAALALLVDIVRHLVAAYGLEGLTERDEHGRLFIKRSGVVLIDEIDAHLHPEWQREIGFWLKRHFPRIQFLVTTHSPIICQAADPGGLFVLPGPGSEDKPRRLTDEERDKIVASRPDTILLTSAFGLENTRSPVAVQARADHARLEGKKRSTGELSPEEKIRFEQTEMFVNTDEDL